MYKKLLVKYILSKYILYCLIFPADTISAALTPLIFVILPLLTSRLLIVAIFAFKLFTRKSLINCWDTVLEFKKPWYKFKFDNPELYSLYVCIWLLKFPS